MLITRALPILLTAVLLGGCATSPRVELSDFGYKYASMAYVDPYRCGTSGYISAETASLGVAYVKAKYFTGVIVDEARFNASTNQLLQSSVEPNKEQCNKIAMDIYSQKRMIDANNRMVESSQAETQNIINNTRVRTTVCNKAGTGMFCTNN